MHFVSLVKLLNTFFSMSYDLTISVEYFLHSNKVSEVAEQTNLFYWNVGSEEVSLFWPLLFLGLLFVDELLECSYRSKFVISTDMIKQYKHMKFFWATQATIHSNKYNFL